MLNKLLIFYVLLDGRRSSQEKVKKKGSYCKEMKQQIYILYYNYLPIFLVDKAKSKIINFIFQFNLTTSIFENVLPQRIILN